MIYICECGKVINMYRKWDGKEYVPTFYAERSGWLHTEITHCLTCGKELIHNTLQKYYP
jgi:hypothetical protein